MTYSRFEVVELGDLVPVGRTQLPAVFTAQYSGDDGGAPNVALTYAVRGGVPECREVNIKATEDGHEVRVTGLAGIRIEDALESAIAELMIPRGYGDRDPVTGLYDWYDPEPGRAEIRATRTVRAARKVRITDALLREVAEVYRANVSDKPTEAVAEHFDKAARTAGLYIARARERGFLNPALKGRAGEQKKETR